MYYWQPSRRQSIRRSNCRLSPKSTSNPNSPPNGPRDSNENPPRSRPERPPNWLRMSMSNPLRPRLPNRSKPLNWLRSNPLNRLSRTNSVRTATGMSMMTSLRAKPSNTFPKLLNPLDLVLNESPNWLPLKATCRDPGATITSIAGLGRLAASKGKHGHQGQHCKNTAHRHFSS